MNVLLHGISTANLQNDDTLANRSTWKTVSCCASTAFSYQPPFSLTWGNTETNADGSARIGPPSSQSALATAGAAGAKKAGLNVLAAHGSLCYAMAAYSRPSCPTVFLFRAGEERTIRAGMIEDDLLEAVIRCRPQPVQRHWHPRLHPSVAPARTEGTNASGGQAQRAQGKVLSSMLTANILKAARRTTCLPEHIEKSSHLRRVPRHRRLFGHRRQPTLKATSTTSTSAAADNAHCARAATTVPHIW